MKSHKKKALEDKCLCTDCPNRFECFTQERIFSDPIFQGLFEALMAEGMSKEEALKEIETEIKFRIGRSGDYVAPITLENPWYDNTYTADAWTYTNHSSGNIDVTYHLSNGKDVSWTANVCAK